jgi:DNA-binding CsgD family transcriptional regulator
MLMQSRQRAQALDALTLKELEVLRLMAEGRSNLGIGMLLGISPKTLDTHVEHILDKLGIQPSDDGHRRVLAVLELLRDRTKDPRVISNPKDGSVAEEGSPGS